VLGGVGSLGSEVPGPSPANGGFVGPGPPRVEEPVTPSNETVPSTCTPGVGISRGCTDRPRGEKGSSIPAMPGPPDVADREDAPRLLAVPAAKIRIAANATTANRKTIAIPPKPPLDEDIETSSWEKTRSRFLPRIPLRKHLTLYKRFPTSWFSCRRIRTASVSRRLPWRNAIRNGAPRGSSSDSGLRH